ncbi:MAG: heme-binding protein [Aestuariibacter sp.]
MIKRILLLSWLLGLLTSCGGGQTVEQEQQSVDTTPPVAEQCTGQCADEASFLTVSDVQQIIAQAVAEANARDVSATIAVVDRVGNVLAVFRMNDADPFVTISSTHNTGLTALSGGLEQVNIIPDSLAAIAKAITAAYISSEGNAFSTRTASQIVQENFNPGEENTPSGPLFGVQFSQLPCSDFNLRFDGQIDAGPKRSPLGLSADPGGFPLYKAGTPVGGIGVIADGIYGLDKNINGFDEDIDEYIALAGSVGYAAPLARRADVITIVGKTGRFSDAVVANLKSSTVASFSEINNQLGQLVAVTGYYPAESMNPDDTQLQIYAGKAFGHENSGIIAADSAVFTDSDGTPLDAFIFADNANVNRFPAVDAVDAPGGNEANRLTAEEVQSILNQALQVANDSRAQIRQPEGSQARVTVSIVDTEGTILGMARTRDAPVFGADVSLQKARTATFFSKTGESLAPAAQLRALATTKYVAPLPEPVDLSQLATLPEEIQLGDYVTQLQSFLGLTDALEALGQNVAFSDRAGGNLSRPHFPDGPAAGPTGPLSKPIEQWSVFNVGLQSDLIYNSVIQHVAYTLGVVPDVPRNCTGNSGLDFDNLFQVENAIAGLANGIQIFPGSVPIYRGNQLVGGIGVSGDGVDQDDMIAFLGLHRAGLLLNTGIQNAPAEQRADKIDIPEQDIRLRYINCPQAPFLNSSVTGVCNGI